ncbi:hypothetical protein [Paraburkholderia silvatlantica]|uniref:hypothetical protein n=1 Tax=Paraburkholderia silvatlantica TaxID=321895 RepID=UPI000DA1C1F6|nr:hypothetical protein [Paraburkholderia silvatlantica]
MTYGKRFTLHILKTIVDFDVVREGRSVRGASCCVVMPMMAMLSGGGARFRQDVPIGWALRPPAASADFPARICLVGNDDETQMMFANVLFVKFTLLSALPKIGESFQR